MDKDALIRQHLKPCGIAFGCAGLGTLLVFWWFPDFKLNVVPVVLLLAGLCIGRFSPREPVDHRGTHVLSLMLVAWYCYIAFSRSLFVDGMLISDWLFEVMLRNIVNGFSLAAGAFLGSRLTIPHGFARKFLQKPYIVPQNTPFRRRAVSVSSKKQSR
jgi:hypothetical protein